MLKFILKIKGGRIFDNERLKQKLSEYLPRLKDGYQELTFQEYFPSRTSSQNKTLWSLWLPFLARYHGISTKDMHIHLKAEYLTMHMQDPLNGKDITISKGTSDLNTKEFSDLIELIRQDYIEEYKLTLPDPIPNY